MLDGRVSDLGGGRYRATDVGPAERARELLAVSNVVDLNVLVVTRELLTEVGGFDEGFDYARNLHDVHLNPGSTRLLLDRPFTGRLPVMHRLDLSVARDFDLSIGKLQVQAGAINVYDRRNMFYYDLYTRRRVDQLPFAPYASVTLRGK